MTSYSMEVSTIEPFLIDEKRITPQYVVFWVYKRLAGQGVLPVWRAEDLSPAPNCELSKDAAKGSYDSFSSEVQL